MVARSARVQLTPEGIRRSVVLEDGYVALASYYESPVEATRFVDPSLIR